MRLTARDGTSWHVDIRGPGELNGGDRRALEELDDERNGLAAGIWLSSAEGDDDEYQVSEDGLSMVRRPQYREISRASLDVRRDLFTTRLVKGWSFDLPVPPPPAALNNDCLPLEAVEAIERVLDQVADRIRNGGPKETPETTGHSATTSPDASAAPPPDSVPETAGPVSGSAGTDG